jgi:hypothetical protein
MSEKGFTLGRDPSLSCEREQRSEGRLILASVRNLTDYGVDGRLDSCALYARMWRRPYRYRVIAPKRGYASSR